MGGLGSGRHSHYGAYSTTDNYLDIDVRRWHRDGLLTPGHTFAWQWFHNNKPWASIQVRTESERVILTYSHCRSGNNWKDKCYPIRLDWTSCYFGGKRPWFLCPAAGCGRRVAILYCGSIFACRHCYHLVYPSQRETDSDRAIRRADKLRQQLGWEPGIINFKGLKPKGMHWCTFENLEAQHDILVKKALASWKYEKYYLKVTS